MVIEDVVIDDFTDRRAGGTAGSTAQQRAEDAASDRAKDDAGGAADGSQRAAYGNACRGGGVAASSPGDSADEAAGLAAMILGGDAV